MDKNDKLYEVLRLLVTKGANNKQIINYIEKADKADSDSYIESLTNCIECFNKDNKGEFTGALYYCLGCYLLEHNDKYRSLNNFIYAIEVFKKYDNFEYIANTYCKISIILSKLREYKASNEALIKGITSALEGNNNKILFYLLIRFSGNLIMSEQYSDAKELLDYAISEYKSSANNISFELNIKKIMAYIDANIGDIEKAFTAARDIIKSIEKEDRKNHLPAVAMICYDCYKRLKDYKSAEGCLLFTYKCVKNTNATDDVCAVICKLIELTTMQNNYDKYYCYSKELFEYSKKNCEDIYIKKSYDYLYQYYKQSENYEKALYYLEKFNAYQGSNRRLSDYNNLLLKLDINTDESSITLKEIISNKTKIVSNMGQRLVSLLDIDNIYLLLCNELKNIIKSDIVLLAIYDSKSDTVNLMDYKDNIITKKVIENDTKKNMPTLRCINNMQNILINDFSSERSFYESKYDVEKLGVTQPLSMIYVPIVYNKQVLGAISLQSLNKNEYGLHDINMLKIIASYLSVAIENARNYKVIEDRAVYDSLTGFLTKGEIINVGNKLAADFNVTNSTFCIFMIDLNDFSNINDTYGHITGDIILKTLADTIKRTVRKSDFVGRYGGDEILIISPQLTGDKGLILENRIKDNVKNTVFSTPEEDDIQITISIGMYEYKDSSVRFIDAVNNADKMLYVDKRAYKYRES